MHVSWLGYIAISSTLLSFSHTVILLIWYIKQLKLNVNCSKMLRIASPCHMARGLCQEEASQSRGLLLHPHQRKAQVETYVLMCMVSLEGRMLLPKAWALNHQHPPLLQWVLQPRVVGFNASSVEVVVTPGFKDKAECTPYVSPGNQTSHIATNEGAVSIHNA